MKKRCYQCGKEWLDTHEAWPRVRVLIDPDTGMPHRCPPQSVVVQSGKWKGYTYAQMAAMWWDQKLKDAKRLNEIRDNSNAS
jgi:hypothetical protein